MLFFGILFKKISFAASFNLNKDKGIVKQLLQFLHYMQNIYDYQTRRLTRHNIFNKNHFFVLPK